MATSVLSLIHSSMFNNHFIPVRVVVDLEPIPETAGAGREHYTPGCDASSLQGTCTLIDT